MSPLAGPLPSELRPIDSVTPQQLIAAVAERLGLGTLAPDDGGAYEVVFDGELDLQFVPLEGSLLLIRSRLSSLPPDPAQQAPVLRKLLNWNLAKLREQRELLTIDRTNREVWLYRLVRSDKTDQAALCSLLEEFLNSLEWWRTSESAQAQPAAALPMTLLRP